MTRNSIQVVGTVSVSVSSHAAHKVGNNSALRQHTHSDKFEVVLSHQRQQVLKRSFVSRCRSSLQKHRANSTRFSGIDFDVSLGGLSILRKKKGSTSMLDLRCSHPRGPRHTRTPPYLADCNLLFSALAPAPRSPPLHTLAFRGSAPRKPPNPTLRIMSLDGFGFTAQVDTSVSHC